MRTSHALANIDNTLNDYNTSADAMRWLPDEDEAARLQRSQWPNLFVNNLPDLTDIEVHIDFDAEPAMLTMADLIRTSHRLAFASRHAEYRRHRKHCTTCNPAGNPPPLAIDGHAYQHRLNARRRRNR